MKFKPGREREKVKKGYKTAISQSKELSAVINDLNAFSELVPELLKRIDDCAEPPWVTRAELKRDFGYTDLALRLLQKSKRLVPVPVDGGSRPMYDLAKALRIRVVEPGVLLAKRIRTVRKNQNITSIYREYQDKLTETK